MRAWYVPFFSLIGFVFMSCASTSGAFTRVPEEDKTIVYEIPYTVSAEQAYKLSRLWIAESFNSAKDVITFEDADLGVITGRFNTEAFFAIQPVTVWINFKITINEDISTLSFSNIAIGQGRIEYENQRNEIKRKTDALYSSYRGYLVK